MVQQCPRLLNRLMASKSGMYHWYLGKKKNYANDELGLTVTLFYDNAMDNAKYKIGFIAIPKILA